MAAQEGRVDVVRLLTEAGAQLDIQTEVQNSMQISLIIVIVIRF